MPVSVHLRMHNFKNHEIQLYKGDKIYLFSDGFPDQFGGEKGKKYKLKAFRRLIASTSNLSMTDQCKAIEKEIDSWTSFGGKHFEQTDDITILGIKV